VIKMFKKKILTLLLIALIAISSINSISAMDNSIRAETYTRSIGLGTCWTEWKFAQYNDAGTKLQFCDWTVHNQEHLLENMYPTTIKFESRSWTHFLPIPWLFKQTIARLELHNYRGGKLYCHIYEDVSLDYFYCQIEYNGKTSPVYEQNNKWYKFDLDYL